MSSLNTSVSSARSEPNARCCHRLIEAAKQIQCQGCYSPLTPRGKVTHAKPHPCLFCADCLGSVTSRGLEKYHRLALSNSSSEQSDIAAWSRHGNNGSGSGSTGKESGSGSRSRHRRFSSNNEVLLNASLKSSISNYNQFNSAPIRPKSAAADTPLNRREFTEKLQELEIRATRCGLCYPWSKRRKLATYCVQCRKYICREHTQSHRTNRYTRLHGTVNLAVVPNDALL